MVSILGPLPQNFKACQKARRQWSEQARGIEFAIALWLVYLGNGNRAHKSLSHFFSFAKAPLAQQGGTIGGLKS